MKSYIKYKAVVLTVCSVAAGIASMYLFNFLSTDKPPEPYDFIWEKVFVSSLIIWSFITGFFDQKTQWLWTLVMAYAHYFSGFFIVKFWGQIPPFELFYLGVLSLPAIAAGFLSSWFSKKVLKKREAI